MYLSNLLKRHSMFMNSLAAALSIFLIVPGEAHAGRYYDCFENGDCGGGFGEVNPLLGAAVSIFAVALCAYYIWSRFDNIGLLKSRAVDANPKIFIIFSLIAFAFSYLTERPQLLIAFPAAMAASIVAMLLGSFIDGIVKSENSKKVWTQGKYANLFSIGAFIPVMLYVISTIELKW